MNTISRDDLRARIEGGEVTVLEALPPAHFQRVHLPGALNLPHDQVDSLAPSLVPDRSSTVVVYCSNLACQNSTIAALRLEALGYTDVLKYAEGKEDWIAAGLLVESGVPAAP